jgi:phosphate transport system substrate-binding protein
MAKLRYWITSAVASVLVLGGAGHAQQVSSTEGLDMQAARAKMMNERGKRISYTKQFDISRFPAYQPKVKLQGKIRIWGSNYLVDGYLARYWEAGFRKFHPGVTFEYRMKTTLAAVPSLVFGVSDLGIGREMNFSEQEFFERYKDRPPIAIEIMTGSYDVPGWSPGYGVVVHKDNPLTKITMEQLDYVFGAERSGGWEGTSWRPERKRGPEKNIRTWGQLGLTGEWAARPINVYGLNLRYHQAAEISDMILGGSDKWNERLKIYANYVSDKGTLERGMNEDLANDPFGIAVMAAPTTNLAGGKAEPGLKMLDLATTAAGPYVKYTLDTLQDRSYPMYDEMWAYLDREPGKPMNPRVLEYLRFILSRDGQQEVMHDAKYLPLTNEAGAKMRERLEAAAR